MNELFLAFTLGNAAILTNACLLPLYPGLLAFLGGNIDRKQKRPWQTTALLGVLVLAGVLSMMLAIGIILTILSVQIGSVFPVLLPVVYGIVLIMGGLMLTGRNPFATLQTAQAPMLKNSYLTAYVYGLLFGPMTLPCTGPILLSAFAVGTGAGDFAADVLYFLAFGLGFGWPLVVLPLFALPFQRQIVRWLAARHDALTRASGVLLIAIGMFGMLTEWLPQFYPQLYLSQAMQFAYWGVALLLTGAFGWWIARHPPEPDAVA